MSPAQKSTKLSVGSLLRFPFYLLGVLSVFACEASQDEIVKNGRSKEAAAAISEQILQAVDEEGNPTAVEGYSENVELKTGDKITSEVYLMDHPLTMLRHLRLMYNVKCSASIGASER